MNNASNYIHKQLKINIYIAITLCFISNTVFGQIFDSEQNPLSVKFRKIYSNGFSIIYPTELENEAQRMANTINKIYPSIGKGFGLQNSSIPIVFQNRGTVANGFVQLAPKKSQFYTTPPQQFDSQDWLNNLAVHELRHVAQFDKITGNKPHPFPEEIYFAYLGLSIPTWFFEGDAVSTETSLTNAGRGRQPNWIMPFRTALLSGQKISYAKAYFGSNKTLVPGYYQLGYLMVSNLRQTYGRGIVDSLLDDIKKRPLRLYPFSRSLKKITGYNSEAYYQQTLAHIKQAWEKQDAANRTETYKTYNRPAQFVSNYFLPTAINQQQILVLKQSKAEAAGFVLVNPDQSEERLLNIAYQEQPWFSYANGTIVWDEIRYDPRYKQRSYSVICLYDLPTRRKRQLTSKSRLFSPTLSADGKKLVAVQVDLSNNFNLVELSLTDGKVVKTYPNPSKAILQTPALNADGSQLSWISVSEKGKSLWLNNGNGNQELIPPTNQQLSRPVFFKDKIAFNAHLSGVDNIYELSIANRKINALTAAKYGAFNFGFSANADSILFNDFGSTGYQIAKTAINPKKVPTNSFVFFGAAAEAQEGIGTVFENIPDSVYTSTAYRPLAHAFNLHSLSPNIDEDDYPGLQLKSNDLLNTLDFHTGISYNTDLRRMSYETGFSYKALYPVLSATYQNRPRTGAYRLDGNITQANWRENYVNLKASLPLSLNAYQHNYAFLAEVGTSFTQRNFEAREAKLFNQNIRFPMSYKIGFSHSVRTAERDVAPRFGQTLLFSYFNQPFDSNLKGDLLAIETSFYFPGLAKNHSLMASFNYQQSSGILNQNNEIATVYGYGQIRARSELRNTLLLSYRFPFAFPDASLGTLAYIKNLRGGFFSHYENIGSETNLAQPKTFGLELRSSINLLRYQPVVDLGARLIFVNKTYHQNPILAFIFNYSF